MRRAFASALVGLLVGGIGAYLLFRPVMFPAAIPERAGAFPVSRSPGRLPSLRRPAPEFALPSLRGGTIRLSAFRGRVVMMNFFASWCAPCADEAPDLRATYEKYRDRGVEFLGVAVLDEFDEARAFLARHRLAYPAVFDQGNRVMTQYQVIGLPTSVFIDPAGQIVDRFVGPFIGPEGAAELERRLARAGAR